MVYLRTGSALVYRIDASDRISYLSPEWETSAQVWPSAKLASDHLIGRPLWDCLQDAVVRELYQALVASARRGRSIGFSYRCDTPDRQRLYHLEIKLSGGNEVEFTSKLEREEVRPAIVLLELDRPRDDSHVLRMCSWCHRIALPVDFWVPLEEAAQLGGFMEADPLPRLVPASCPQCERMIRKKGET